MLIIITIIIIIDESGTKVGVSGWSVNAHLPLTPVRLAIHDRDDDDDEDDDDDDDDDDCDDDYVDGDGDVDDDDDDTHAW